MRELSDFKLVKPLFLGMKHDLFLKHLETDSEHVRIWADDKENPAFAILLSDMVLRAYGSPASESGKMKLERFLKQVINGEIKGIESNVAIYFQEPLWEELLLSFFKNYRIWQDRRIDFLFPLESIDSASDSSIKEAAFALKGNYKNKELLEETMESIAVYEDFSKNHFGFCRIKDNEIKGYMLSEKNSLTGCELRIGVFEQSNPMKPLFLAFANEAKHRGYTEIGFSCHAKNTEELSLVTDLGFEKTGETKVIYLEY